MYCPLGEICLIYLNPLLQSLHVWDFFLQIMMELEVVGEDDHSFQEHINAINDELRHCQPDIPNIMDRMRWTLYKRVEHMGKPIEEVMGMFPFLRALELVSS